MAKKTKLLLSIESDGTVDGTKITLNGEKLSVKDFSFSFYPENKEKPISCSYSKIVETDAGFSRTEHFDLSKGCTLWPSISSKGNDDV